MATTGTPGRQAGTDNGPRATPSKLKHDAAFQAFWLLRAAFTVAPILFGLDKFFHILVDWDRYLAPDLVSHTCPGPRTSSCTRSGSIEIVAGTRRRTQAPLRCLPRRRLARWDHREPAARARVFYDVALRDFGLFLAAVGARTPRLRLRPWPLGLIVGTAPGREDLGHSLPGLSAALSLWPSPGHVPSHRTPLHLPKRTPPLAQTTP